MAADCLFWQDRHSDQMDTEGNCVQNRIDAEGEGERSRKENEGEMWNVKSTLVWYGNASTFYSLFSTKTKRCMSCHLKKPAKFTVEKEQIKKRERTGRFLVLVEYVSMKEKRGVHFDLSHSYCYACILPLGVVGKED